MTELNESIVAPLDRRRLLHVVGVAGLAGVVAACGGGSETNDASTGNDGTEPDDTADDEQPDDSGSDDEQGASDEPDPDNGEGEPAAEALTATGDVPVGGGVIVAGVVVTQPAAGDFRGFSSTCTHQGCTVSSVSDGIISCPCHGSQYSAEDGSVARGPATAPLPEVDITVDGDQIVRG